MNEPPAIGSERHQDAYLLTCAYTGLTPYGPQCGRPATVHARASYEPDMSASSCLSCDDHADILRRCGVVDEHSTQNSACGMPGSIWADGKPSRCEIDGSGSGTQLTATRELELIR